MDSPIEKTKDSKTLLLIVLLLLSLFCLVVYLDIPIARQVIGFLYLSFVPGFVFLRLLKLKNLCDIETIVLSVGFSVAFVMIIGLLVNEIGFIMGFSNPLNPLFLMIALNSIILIVSIFGRIGELKIRFTPIQSRRILPTLFLLFSIPVLSVVGAIWVNSFENNTILLFLMLAISLVFAMGVISDKLLPPKLYALAIFVIAISLLYHSLLISNYTLSFGSDAATELFSFKNVQDSAYWGSPTKIPRFGSMLSITILPTLYSDLLNVNPTWTFKIFFPIIFSFVPLGLFQVWRKYVGEKYAFISAFLFMAQQTFYFEMVSLNRQMVGELFFVLLLLVILRNGMKQSSRMVCFVVFAFGLVTSHYGLSEIFLFLISMTFIFFFVIKRPSRNITASMLVLFFVVMFTWYIYTSGSGVFNSILEYGDYVYNQLGEFLNPASRGTTVLRGLGLESPPTLLHTFSRAFAYFTQFLIILGFVGLATKRIKVHVDRSQFALISIAVSFLFALILVPGLANTLNMTRFYHILLFFLAPLSVMGAMFVFSLLSKRKEEIRVSVLLLIVLISYFLFQTNFVYEVTGSDSWSVPLSKNRMSPLRLYGHYGYIDSHSVFGAQWLSRKIDVEHTQIYADSASRRNVLTAYGMIYLGDVVTLSNVTKILVNDIVYLSPLNTVDGIIVGEFYMFNYSELSILDDVNKIYANGECEIFQKG